MKELKKIIEFGYKHEHIDKWAYKDLIKVAESLGEYDNMLSLITQMKEALDDKSTNVDGLTVNETGWLLGINKILDNLK